MILKIKSKGIEYVCHYDDEDHAMISKYKWRVPPGGYAQAHIEGKTINMHKFLTNTDASQIIDHIDNNRLNNQRSNLRIADRSINAQNSLRRKRENSSSQYIGVMFHKGKYCVNIMKQGVKFQEYYKEELHAAYAYDLKARELFGQHAMVNGVEMPEGFVRYVQPEKKIIEEKYICLIIGNKWQVQINNTKHQYCKHFFNLEDAIEARDEQIAIMNDKMKTEKLKNSQKPIPRNVSNQAVIKIDEKECLVSDVDYHWLSDMCAWHHHISGYAAGYKGVLMHRKIMEREIEESRLERPLVDHINGNRLDNRRENLRVVDALTNSHNKIKSNNTSSRFVGVTLNKNSGKFCASIRKDGKRYNCGSYLSEEAAGLSAWNMSRELYGQYARTPDDSLLNVEGWKWCSTKKRMIQEFNYS